MFCNEYLDTMEWGEGLPFSGLNTFSLPGMFQDESYPMECFDEDFEPITIISPEIMESPTVKDATCKEPAVEKFSVKSKCTRKIKKCVSVKGPKSDKRSALEKTTIRKCPRGNNTFLFSKFLEMKTKNNVAFEKLAILEDDLQYNFDCMIYAVKKLKKQRKNQHMMV